MDNLTHEIRAPIGILLQRGKGHMYGPLYAKTKAEMTRNEQLHSTYLQRSWSERTPPVLKAEIFYLLDDGTRIVIGNPVELRVGHVHLLILSESRCSL